MKIINQIQSVMLAFGVSSALLVSNVGFAAPPSVYEVQKAAESYNDTSKLMINRHNIRVWVANKPDSKVFSYKATTAINSNVTGVVATIMNTNDLSDWVPYTKSVRVIERNDQDGTFVLHMILSFPFPLSNRDVVVKGYWAQLPDGRAVIHSKAVEDGRVPASSKYVRITEYEGSWVVKPLNKTTSEVSVMGFADPAGGIPLGIANKFVQIQPYTMLRNMPLAVVKNQTAVVPLIKN